MKEGLKCAAVFIGTVIGAGFATGQEVLLYFGRSSIAVPIFSGILLGLFNAYFLAIGAKFNDRINEHTLQNKAKALYDVCMFICAYITFIAMFSGVETLFVKIFDIKYTSVAWVVAAGFIAANGLRFMKGLNSVAVPVILLLTVVIFVYSDKEKASGAYNFFQRDNVRRDERYVVDGRDDKAWKNRDEKVNLGVGVRDCGRYGDDACAYHACREKERRRNARVCRGGQGRA